MISGQQGPWGQGPWARHADGAAADLPLLQVETMRAAPLTLDEVSAPQRVEPEEQIEGVEGNAHGVKADGGGCHLSK